MRCKALGLQPPPLPAVMPGYTLGLHAYFPTSPTTIRDHASRTVARS